MPRVFFVATRDGIESLYEDRIDYEKFLPADSSLNVRRNSVINPVESGLRFVIKWLDPWLIKLFGPQTDTDDHGRPFRSHGAAVCQEVKMLKEGYFKLLPCGSTPVSTSTEPGGE